MIGRPKLILASASPRRLSLINQAGIEPDALRPADIDETPRRGELPRVCANRIARSKAEVALAGIGADEDVYGSYILAADTVVAVGRRILPKAELIDEAAQCLRLLSGRNHRVYTALCLVTPKQKFRQRVVETRLRFKRLSAQDIEFLSRLRRVARQGGRLCRPRARRYLHRQAGRLVHQCGGPAAVRNRVVAVRRGLSDPFRLAERRLSFR